MTRCERPCDFEELAKGVFRCRRCNHMHSTIRYRDPDEREEARRILEEFERAELGKPKSKLIIVTKGIKK